MKRQYWTSEIQKNWNGELQTEMLDQNIVCYGKPNSGKAEKVIKPFLRRAIEKKNSILLVTSGEKTDYSDIFTLAKEAGYKVSHYTAIYETETKWRDVTNLGMDLLEEIMDGPVLVEAKMDPGKKYAYSTVQAALSALIGICEQELEEEKDLRNLSLAVEDCNWELLIKHSFLTNNWINTCLTFDNRRLCASTLLRERMESAYWRQDHAELEPGAKVYSRQEIEQAMAGGLLQTKTLLDSKLTMDDYYPFVPILDHKENREFKAQRSLGMTGEEMRKKVYETTLVEIFRFFQNVQTVICAGVDGISPEEHKAFLKACIVSEGTTPPSGKYLVTELTAPSQPIPKARFPKTVLTLPEKYSTQEYYKFIVRPGRCVIESNGVVMFFARHNGVLNPLIFDSSRDALAWLELYFTQQGWGWPEPVEMDMCCIRYLLPTYTDGKQDEITVSYIQKDDVQSYLDQMEMVAMAVEEYLVNPDLMAEVPELALKKEAANVSLQKLVSFACRNYHTVRKVKKAELPVDEETNREVESMIEAYKWRPYQKVVPAEPMPEPKTAMEILPAKKILFLGGHANMVKKLRQFFPGWDFLTDDELGSWTGGECEVIFFWTAHCSHLIQQYVNARKSKDTPYIYVTATNIDRLISEMATKYKNRKVGEKV